MIPKSEVMAHANKTNLSPHVIEKDYALGWVLAGIFNQPELKHKWIFKGGTCLKKCYFETYRFSEDLDFTLSDPSHIDHDFLKRQFSEVSEWVYGQSGLSLPVDKIEFDIYENKMAKTSCQGKLSYLGPLAPTSPKQWPRIKLDLTHHELLADTPQIVGINHPYSDLPEVGINILAYSYDEVFAEKTRALSERTRPRDLYDVINLFRQVSHFHNKQQNVLKILKAKCEFKNAKMPTYHDLEKHYESCRIGWGDQLAHQVVTLAPFDSYWNELPAFFDWLNLGKKQAFVAISEQDNPVIFDEPTEQFLAQYSVMDAIRFAAASRLCVNIRYRKEDGVIQNYLIEPYSLRITRERNLLLYAYKHDERVIRGFRVDRIISISVSHEVFQPVYAVEIFPKGQGAAGYSQVKVRRNDWGY